MANMAFDTLGLTDRLERAGFNRLQSESIVRAIAEVQTVMLTKTDLEATISSIRLDVAAMKVELDFLKRMTTAIFLVVMVQLAKTFIQ